MNLAAQERCLEDPNASESPWSHGPAVHAALGAVEFAGSTSGNGTVRFAAQERSTAAYRISNVQPYGVDGGVFINVGIVDVIYGIATSASPMAGWSMRWPDPAIQPSDRLSVSTRTLRLLTNAATPPFVYIDKSDPECAGPNCAVVVDDTSGVSTAREGKRKNRLVGRAIFDALCQHAMTLLGGARRACSTGHDHDGLSAVLL